MNMRIRRLIVPLLWLLLSLAPALAVAQDGLRHHATMFGLGHRNMLDTYLSPQEYTGTELRLLREHQRQTTLLDGRVGMMNILQGNFAYTKSATEDGKYLAGLVNWDFLWHYQWQVLDHLQLAAGAGTGAEGGFAYNTRNGNNPAQARLAWHVSATASARYTFQLWGRSCALRYLADLPLAGLRFSPNYGQSYYEIFSLGHGDHNVCFTNLGQAFSLNQQLMLDLPLGAHTLRLGYLMSIQQSYVNHLKVHDWSHVFMLGYVKHFRLVR